MDFSEDNQKLERTGKRSGIIVFFLLLLVITAIAIAMYFKSQGLELGNISVDEFLQDLIGESKAAANDVDRDFEISYEVKEHPSFGVYKDVLVKCTGEYLIALNKKGEEQWKIPVLLDKPLIKTGGQDMLIADIGGRNLYIINGKSIKWKISTEADIINADISEDGYVTVVQEQVGYKARVTVYDPNGMDIFARNIVESFVISAMVSPSGKQVLINGLDVSGVNATTTLEFTDILGNPSAAKTLKQNEIFPSVLYLGDNSVVSAGGKFVTYLDKNRELKWEKEFDNIMSTAVLQNKYIAIAHSGIGNGAGGNETVVEIFGINGHKTAEFLPEDRVAGLSGYSDMLAVNTGREVYFINSRGKLIGKYTAKADIKSVYFFSKLEAAVITKTNVVIFNIGG